MNATKVRLYGSTPTDAIETPVLSILFGEMVKRVIPVTQQYLSDLYHDAQWLEANVTRPTWFYFIVRQSGTDIGEMARLYMKNRNLLSSGDVIYRVTVERDDLNVWYAQFESTPATDY